MFSKYHKYERQILDKWMRLAVLCRKETARQILDEEEAMIKELNELIAEIQSGVVVSRIECKGDASVGEMRVLSLRAISCGRIDLNELDRIKIGKQIDPAKITVDGDVIIKMNKPYDAVFIDRFTEGLLLPSFCCKVSGLNTEWVDPYYLTGYLNSRFVKDYLITANVTSAASLLKIRDIKKLPIALPPMQEQKVIGEIFNRFCMKQVLLKQIQENGLQLMEEIFAEATAEEYQYEKK